MGVRPCKRRTLCGEYTFCRAYGVIRPLIGRGEKQQAFLCELNGARWDQMLMLSYIMIAAVG